MSEVILKRLLNPTIELKKSKPALAVRFIWNKLLPALFFFQAGSADNFLSMFLFFGFGFFCLGVVLK